MTHATARLITVTALAALALAGCSNGPKGVRITNGGTSATSAKQGAPIRALSGSDVSAALVGKTFQYTGDGGNGFVTYNGDGTFNYQDDSKGEGTGRWTVSGGQYCESYGSAPAKCGEFKSTGDAYFAAGTHLVEMKV